MSTFDNFSTFFTDYVQQYKPYKDSPFFNIFTSYLRDTVFNDSYNTIPASFSSAYNQQTIPKDMVNPFLLSLGLTDTVIAKLSDADKSRVILSIGDFHKYKGTVKLVDNLLTNFASKTSITVYELYLDKQNSTSKWNVLPKKLSASSLASDTLSSLPFSVLSGVPHWHLDELSLDALYDAGEIILPYKTNVLYVTGQVYEELALINELVAALVRGSFGTDFLQLFFSDGSSYATTFENTVDLWFYILRKLANKGTHLHPFNATNVPTFDPSAVYNQFEIETIQGQLPRGKTNIQTILNSYFSLYNNTSTETISQDIWGLFPTITPTTSVVASSTTTFNQYHATTRAALGSGLIDYIDNLIDGSKTPATVANTLLGDLHNSFLVFKSVTTSTLKTDYIDMFLLTLPGYTKDIATSGFYVLLDFLKPMHCDIGSMTLSPIVSHCLFDNGLVGYTSVFSQSCEKVTHQAVSDNVSTNQKFNPIYDNMFADSALTNAGANVVVSGMNSVGEKSGPYTYYNPNTSTTIVYTT